MILNKTVAVVMPAYNAEETLEITLSEVPMDIVDYVILVDDCSSDETSKLASKLNIQYVIKHDKNKGYGGNQKTCYDKALEIKADIVVMLHPDYQYTPKLIHSMCYLIANDVYPVVFGSRILGVGAVKGGMPVYKFIANRFLTLFQNLVLWQKLSEYHTGYRAFNTEVLRKINYNNNSDDFIFDNEMIAQIFSAGYEIAEITCPTRYFKEASSISFLRSVKYGFGVLKVSILYRLHKWNIIKYKILQG
ncbi:MAG TPA: glycosyltransferase family 2 protein [Prolixibacteraceae bacterium]|nr:glycosyltransferase family 2 protein [Prolixibacteraceae bacterium]